MVKALSNDNVRPLIVSGHEVLEKDEARLSLGNNLASAAYLFANLRELFERLKQAFNHISAVHQS